MEEGQNWFPLILMPAGSLFSSEKVRILQFYQLIRSLKNDKSAVYFAILQEGMTEFLSCDNPMPSLSFTSKTLKGLISLADVSEL